MKKITNEEVQALYNDFEGARKRLSEELNWLKPETIRQRYGRISTEVRAWIDGKIHFSKLDSSDKSDALGLLFYNDKDTYTYVVIEALHATRDPKLVEVAEKLKMFKHAFPRSVREKINIGRKILEYSDGGRDAVKVDRVINVSGKKLTVGKELDQIRKREMKANANEQKRMRKFRNISNIGVRSLYYAIIEFMRENYEEFGNDPLEKYYYTDEMEYHLGEVRERILENRFDAIRMFYKQEDLAFARGQKTGKIK